jgi:hypothetical protein
VRFDNRHERRRRQLAVGAVPINAQHQPARRLGILGDLDPVVLDSKQRPDLGEYHCDAFLDRLDGARAFSAKDAHIVKIERRATGGQSQRTGANPLPDSGFDGSLQIAPPSMVRA